MWVQFHDTRYATPLIVATAMWSASISAFAGIAAACLKKLDVGEMR